MKYFGDFMLAMCVLIIGFSFGVKYGPRINPQRASLLPNMTSASKKMPDIPLCGQFDSHKLACGVCRVDGDTQVVYGTHVQRDKP